MEDNNFRIENAIIKDISISMEDHGCLTFLVFLSGGSWSQGFGGYQIGRCSLGSKKFTTENGKGLEAMMHIMNVVGVSKWESLKGKYVRCKTYGYASGSYIGEIGNILEDKWFNIREFFNS